LSGAPGLRRHDQPVDDDVEHPDLAVHGLGGVGAAAHDQAGRAQEQDVAHQRPGQLLDQGRDLGSHPLQAGDLREQGKENLGPHRAQHSWRKRIGNAIWSASFNAPCRKAWRAFPIP
jgi:hypothetical protein